MGDCAYHGWKLENVANYSDQIEAYAMQRMLVEYASAHVLAPIHFADILFLLPAHHDLFPVEGGRVRRVGEGRGGLAHLVCLQKCKHWCFICLAAHLTQGVPNGSSSRHLDGGLVRTLTDGVFFFVSPPYLSLGRAPNRGGRTASRERPVSRRLAPSAPPVEP